MQFFFFFFILIKIINKIQSNEIKYIKQVFDLSTIDLAEMARNSVLQSSLEDLIK